MVVINAILSGEIQLTQYAQLKELPVVDQDKLSAEEKAAFDAVELGQGILTQAELLSPPSAGNACQPCSCDRGDLAQ